MKTIFIVVLIIVVAVGAGITLILRKQDRLAQEVSIQTTPVVVVARRLLAQQVTLTLPTTVDVQAVRDRVVASPSIAYVTTLPLFEGDHFRRGDLLVQLSTVPDSGQAQGSSLVETVAAAESRLKAERERLRRDQALYQIQGISREQLESAEASFAVARTRFVLAEENLHNATVVAPFSGVISQRLVQPGDLVTPGKTLLKIIDIRSGNRLLVSVPTSVQPTALRVGEQVLPLHPWPKANSQGLRRYEARSQLGAFIPGQRITAQLVVFESAQAVFLPSACLLNDDGRSATVLRLVDDSKTEQLHLVLAAAGIEGAATLDNRLIGQRVVCASLDILTRLAAGVPFSLEAAPE